MPWDSRSSPSRVGGALAALLIGLGACSSGGSGAGAACGEVERLVEPGGSPHVIDPDGGSWRHHPPASGAHFAGNPPEAGVHTEPVSEARQVTALEFEIVVVSYAPGVGADDRAALEALTDGRDDVLVTPAAAPIDDAAEVAFTAWERRQLCREVSIAAAEAFVDEYAGRGPESLDE